MSASASTSTVFVHWSIGGWWIPQLPSHGRWKLTRRYEPGSSRTVARGVLSSPSRTWHDLVAVALHADVRVRALGVHPAADQLLPHVQRRRLRRARLRLAPQPAVASAATTRAAARSMR